MIGVVRSCRKTEIASPPSLDFEDYLSCRLVLRPCLSLLLLLSNREFRRAFW